MTKKADYLGALESAIAFRHKCTPTHRETVFVHEKTADNQTVWQGNVEVFDLNGHNDARVCYAWEHKEDNGRVKIIAVLGNDFIHSPSRAIQAAIFVDEQPIPRTFIFRGSESDTLPVK